MKKMLFAAVLAVTMAFLAGVGSKSLAAAPASPTFSVVVHIEYPDGFVYEHAFVTGVAAQDVHAYLAECGKSHRDSNWLKLRCFAVPE